MLFVVCLLIFYFLFFICQSPTPACPLPLFPLTLQRYEIIYWHCLLWYIINCFYSLFSIFFRNFAEDKNKHINSNNYDPEQQQWIHSPLLRTYRTCYILFPQDEPRGSLAQAPVLARTEPSSVVPLRQTYPIFHTGRGVSHILRARWAVIRAPGS